MSSRDVSTQKCFLPNTSETQMGCPKERVEIVVSTHPYCSKGFFNTHSVILICSVAFAIPILKAYRI